MRILLTNDDGIDGEGLWALFDALSPEHEVWVIAPDSNRSAVSNGITLAKNLVLTKIRERVYSSSGLPADCVSTGLLGNLISGGVDIVLSGINRGANLGTDIVYSGTAAAARQAVLVGVPGIAFSVESPNDDYKYLALADFAKKNLLTLKNICKSGEFLNINALSADSYKGVQFTGVSVRKYKDTVKVFADDSGVLKSSLSGGTVLSHGDFSSDFSAVENGNISVSRVIAEPVCAENEIEAEWVL